MMEAERTGSSEDYFTIFTMPGPMHIDPSRESDQHDTIDTRYQGISARYRV
jgi:hypothetical protein